MSFEFREKTATQTGIREGIRTVPVWLSYTGLDKGSTTGTLEFFHRLCNVQGLADIVQSPENESQVFEAGKNRLTIFDRITLDDFDLTVKGDSIDTISSLVGQDLTVQPNLSIDGIRDNVGALILLSYDVNDNLFCTDIICDVSVKLLTLPGITDGVTQWSVQLFSDNPTVDRIWGAYSIGVDFWYDDGTNIINAAAPNGTLTAFTLGTGNKQDLGAVSVSPTAVEIFPSAATDVDKFYYRAYLDQVRVAQSDLASATSTVITFTSAPSDGAKLLAFYLTADTTLPHTDTLFDVWEDLQ